MTTAEYIRDLCHSRGTSVTKLEAALGYSNGSLTKTSYPRADRLYAVAQYFGVSMEYLLTGAEAAPEAAPEKIRANDAAKSADAPLSAREADLVKKFRRLDERGRRTVENALEAALLEVTANGATRDAAREEIA